MADQSNPTPEEDDNAPNAAEAWTLINLLLDDAISEKGRLRLETLATNDPAIARMYVRVMHVWSQLPLHLGKKPQIPPSWQTEATNELLSETMILDALRLEPTAEDGIDQDIFQPAKASVPRSHQPTVWQRAYALKRWIGIAALLALCSSIAWLVWPTSPAAVVTATAGLDLEGSTPLKPGTSLEPGQSIHLTRGAVELRFRSGAAVTIAGPAQFSLDQNNSMSLRHGVLAAQVPHHAVGFAVNAPGLKVVDLGTSFGIRTLDNDGGSEAAVFEGNVTAMATDPQGLGMSNPVPMTANFAATHVYNGAIKPMPTVYAPDQYPRDISKIRLPLRLFDTGAEMAPTGGDAHWQVRQVALHADWIPEPADLFHPSSQINAPAAACISAQGVGSPPPAGEYVFRTTVNLTGFEPGSAEVTAHVFATEAIVDIRINGSPALGASLLDLSNGEQPHPHTLQLPGQFWKPGTNTIDFVLNYLPDDMPRSAFAGLAVTWDASASPIVKR